MTPTASVVRGLEAGSIASTLLLDGGNFGDAVGMVWGDLIADIKFPAINQRECRKAAKVPCPVLSRAVGTTIGAMQGTTGVIAVELLAALMAALRRLADLEGVTVADVVARLVDEAKE